MSQPFTLSALSVYQPVRFSAAAVGGGLAEPGDDSGRKKAKTPQKTPIPPVPTDKEVNAAMRGKGAKGIKKVKRRVNPILARFQTRSDTIQRILDLYEQPTLIPAKPANKIWRFLGKHLLFVSRHGNINSLVRTFEPPGIAADLDSDEGTPACIHNMADIIYNLMPNSYGVNPFAEIRSAKLKPLTAKQSNRLTKARQTEKSMHQAALLSLLAFLPYAKSPTTPTDITKQRGIYITEWNERVLATTVKKQKAQKARLKRFEKLSADEKRAFIHKALPDQVEINLRKFYIASRNVSSQAEAIAILKQLVPTLKTGIQKTPMTILRSLPVIEETVKNLERASVFRNAENKTIFTPKRQLFPVFYEITLRKNNRLRQKIDELKQTGTDKKETQRKINILQNRIGLRTLAGGAVHYILESEYHLDQDSDDDE